MKVFISSVITGFEAFRDAAAGAVKALGYDVIRAEDFAASTSSPQVACLRGIREADLVLMLLRAPPDSNAARTLARGAVAPANRGSA